MNSLNFSFNRSLTYFSKEDSTFSSKTRHDRFIPNRQCTESDLTNYDTPERLKSKKQKKNKHMSPLKSIPVFTSESPESSNKKRYTKMLKQNILGKKHNKTGSVLSFASSSKRGSALPDTDDICKIISAMDLDFGISNCLLTRTIPLPKKPVKILDAPEMEDDFYKQLLHWSSTENKIAIGLSNSVYIWDALTRSASLLCEFFEYEELCSLRWSPRGDQLAFGMGSGEIKLWDIQKNENIQSMSGHSSRVSTLDWTSSTLFSGSKDKTIQMIDPRIDDFSAKEFSGHSRQILNIKSAPLDEPYILSGGNDSKVMVFDTRKEQTSIFKETHEGPVRALGWSTHKKGQFASGGGSTDMMLKKWDLQRNKLLDQVHVGAQICDLQWSELEKEIVVSLGGDSNSVDFYTSKDLQKVGKLKGHTMRVLNVDFSPDGTQLVSVSPDETMRFWEVNEVVRQRSKTQATPVPKFNLMFGMR
jgi:cell division cycle 20-like protein 1 (cofactor of APC complex)